MGKASGGKNLVLLSAFLMALLPALVRAQDDFDKFPFTSYRYAATKTTTSDSTDTVKITNTEKGVVVVSEEGGARRTLTDFLATMTVVPPDPYPMPPTRTVFLHAPERSFILYSSEKLGSSAVELGPKADAAALKMFAAQHGEEAITLARGELLNGPSLRELLGRRKEAHVSETLEGGLRVVRADVLGSPSTRIEFRLDPAREGRIVAVDWRIDAQRTILNASIEYAPVKGVLFPSRLTVARNTGYEIKTSVLEISDVEINAAIPPDLFTPKGLTEWMKLPDLSFVVRDEKGEVIEAHLGPDGKYVPVPPPVNMKEKEVRLGIMLLSLASILSCLFIAAAFALWVSRRKR